MICDTVGLSQQLNEVYMKIPYEGKKRFVTFEGDEPMQGFVYDTGTVDTTDDPYDGHFFIQHSVIKGPTSTTVWYLIIDRSEYCRNDLSELERFMAQWVRDEGLVFGEHITEDMAQ